MPHTHNRPLILFLIANEGFVKSHRLHLLQHFVSLGFRVGIAMSPPSSPIEFEAMGIEVYPLKTLSRNNLNPWKELQTIWEIKKLYQKLRPSIVHHVGVKLIFEGTIAASLGNVNNVINAFSGMGYMFLNNPSLSFFKRTLLVLYRTVVIKLIQCLERPQTHRHICQNTDDTALLKSLFRSPVLCIEGNGIDLNIFPKRSFELNSPCRILAMGRLLYSKGLGDLVEAVKHLRKKHNVVAVLAGGLDPQNPDAISESVLKQWIAEGSVEWVPPSKGTKIAHLLQTADIACLPSYREGMSRSLQEACAAGLPIVTTDVPGCRDIGRGGAACLVPVKNPIALEKALKSLMMDLTLRQTLGQKARQEAEERFSYPLILKQFETLHRELLDDSAS